MAHSEKVRDYATRFPLGYGSFLGPGEEENGMERKIRKPEGQWNYAADVMVSKFEDSGHPVFRASSALDRELFQKRKGEMYDSLQCGSFECRAFISHFSFCKSAQYVQSNRGLV